MVVPERVADLHLVQVDVQRAQVDRAAGDGQVRARRPRRGRSRRSRAASGTARRRWRRPAPRAGAATSAGCPRRCARPSPSPPRSASTSRASSTTRVIASRRGHRERGRAATPPVGGGGGGIHRSILTLASGRPGRTLSGPDPGVIPGRQTAPCQAGHALDACSASASRATGSRAATATRSWPRRPARWRSRRRTRRRPGWASGRAPPRPPRPTSPPPSTSAHGRAHLADARHDPPRRHRRPALAGAPRRPLGAAPYRTRWRQLGLTDEVLESCLQALPDILADGPLTRHEIRDALAARGVTLDSPDPQAHTHAVLHASVVGPALPGARPRAGRDLRGAATTGCPTRRTGPSGDDALAELARRYFAAFSPATAADFATWSGLAGRRAVELIRDELTPADVDGTPGLPARRGRAAARRAAAAGLRQLPDRLPRPARDPGAGAAAARLPGRLDQADRRRTTGGWSARGRSPGPARCRPADRRRRSRRCRRRCATPWHARPTTSAASSTATGDAGVHAGGVSSRVRAIGTPGR